MSVKRTAGPADGFWRFAARRVANLGEFDSVVCRYHITASFEAIHSKK
jgi:hypothetical protein